MIVITESGRSKGATAAALGIFDGVHLGHRRVLSAAREMAARYGVEPAVFTFRTGSVTSKSGMQPLMTDSEKLRRLEEAGIKCVLSAEFSDMKDMDAEQFVKEVLAQRLCARFAVCGHDFRFGKGGRADSRDLAEIAKRFGIGVMTVNQLTIGGEPVSSTRIRELIRQGSIAYANELLGYRYRLHQKVIHGNAIGRTWDFPTINQVIPEGLALPRFGVYCSKVFVDGAWRAGVTNIGVKPTVDKSLPPLAETFIIDYEGDLYGRELDLELYEFVRPERTFASFDELKAEIGRNTEFTKRYFGRL